MKCSVCNAELKEGQSFCSYCGTKVEAEPVAEPNSSTDEVQQPAAQTISYTEASKSSETENSSADGQALAGLILGICSLTLCCIGLPSGIVGIILSAKGLKSKTRKGMAIPGLILSILAVINFFSFWIGFAGGIAEEIAYLSMSILNLFS